NEALGLVTLVGLITIALSVYMITYSHFLYSMTERWLPSFERAHPYREDAAEQHLLDDKFDVILYGMGRFGEELGQALLDAKVKFAIVDFNPEVVKKWQKKGVEA